LHNHIHIVFGPSAAGTLRSVLADLGRRRRVLSPVDDFSYGPLAPDDAATRAQWERDVLGHVWPAQVTWPGFPEVAPDIGLEHDGDIIAWVSPDRTSSLCRYLWWLSRVGDRPIRLNSINHMDLMYPEQFLAHLESHVELSAGDRHVALDRWQALVNENAPLRILTDAGLVSAPLDHFDAALLAHVTGSWKKMSWVVGGAIVAISDETGCFQTGDMVLGGRLRALARSGVIEWRGDLDHFLHWEVRLPGGGA
jgi:hypothetical protein